MRTAVVLAGGDPVDPALRSRLVGDAFIDVFVVAADSGVYQAERLGLQVDILVGDMDSADASAVDAVISAGGVVEEHPTAKDATDLELALEVAVREGAERIIVVGGAGGRLDHFLGNLAVLSAPALAAVTVEAYLGLAYVQVVQGGGTVDVSGLIGSLVTLLPTGGTVVGITTRGLEYPLLDETLFASTSRGVSNVLVESPARVDCARGTLLVIQPDAGTGLFS